MEKGPVFESEKLAKKQRKRRILLIVLAALLVLGAAAAAAVVSKTCADRRHTEGGDLPFGYTWKEKLASTELEVSRIGANGLEWRVVDDGAEFGAVSVSAPRQTESATVLSLTPTAEGRSKLKLALGSDSEGTFDTHEMEFLLECVRRRGRLVCSVLAGSCKATGNSVSDDTAAFPYRIFTDSDGFTVIETPNVYYDWECELTGSAAELMGVAYDEGVVLAYIREGSEQGSGEAVLSSPSEGKVLKARYESGEDGLVLTVVETSEDKPESAPESTFIVTDRTPEATDAAQETAEPTALPEATDAP